MLAILLLPALAKGQGGYFEEVWSASISGQETEAPILADLFANQQIALITANESGTVTAYNSTNGEVIWSTSLDAPNLTSPLVGAFSHDGALDVIVSSYDGDGKALYLLEGSTGEVLCTYPLKKPPTGPPVAFALEGEAGEPIRHGVAIIDTGGNPYLLQANEDSSKLTNVREISEELLAKFQDEIPVGSPASGALLSEKSVDIVFAFESGVAILNRDGDPTIGDIFYKFPPNTPGKIATSPTIANVKQNTRTDGKDWEEIIIGLFDSGQDISDYQLLEYNEQLPEDKPLRDFWSRMFDSPLEKRPYTATTINLNSDDRFTEVVVSGRQTVRGLSLSSRPLSFKASQRFSLPPINAWGAENSSLVFAFEVDGRVSVRQVSSLNSDANYKLPAAPLVSPVIGDVNKDTQYEMFVILEDKLTCYTLPEAKVTNPLPIAFQSERGTIYGNGGYHRGYLDEELQRRSALQDKKDSLFNRAKKAKEDGDLAEARELVDQVLKIEPTREDAQKLSGAIFFRQNLIGLIAGALIFILVSVVGGALIIRVVGRSMGLRKARQAIDSGHPADALPIYHKLHEKYPKDTNIHSSLVETIINTGTFTDESIAPLWTYYSEQEAREDVLKALVSCYLNRNETDPKVFPLYQEAEAIMPENADLRFLIGLIHKNQGESQQAQQKLREATKLDDPPKAAFTELADLLLNAEQANAHNVGIFKEAYEAAPNEVGFLQGYCLALIDDKKIDAEAQKIYELMLDHDKTFVPALLQLCQAKIQGGNINEAVVFAHKIQELDPTNKEGIYLLSQCYLIQGRSDETAMRTLKKASDIFTDDKEIQAALARSYIQLKRADEEAVGVYRRAWELNPHDVEITKTMAKVAWAQKDMELVIGTNEKLLEAGALTPKNLQQLAKAYVVLDNRSENAERVLRDALKTEPENKKFIIQLSHVFASQDRVDSEALKIYAAAYRLETDYEIGRMLVQALYHNDQFNEIVQLAPKLLQQNPSDDELQKIYAQANVASDRMDDAIAQFEQVLKHNPDDSEALVNLAQAYAQKGETSERARDLYQKAIAQDETVDQVWVMLAKLAMDSGNEEEAVASFKKALKAKPDRAVKHIGELQLLLSRHHDALRLRWLLAEMLVFSHRLREATEELTAIFESDPSQLPLVIKGYTKILEKDPKNQTALLARGQMYRSQGSFEEARKDLEAAFELNSANPDAQRELGELYQGMLNENDDIEIRHEMGRVLMLAEEFDRAIACFQRTAQDYRFEKEATKLLGQCFVAKNMLDLALQEFKKLPVDDELKDILYDLGQRYEGKKDMIGAKTVYKSLFAADINFRDVKSKFEGLAGSTSDPMVFEKTVMQTQLSPEAQRRYELIDELGRGAMGIVYKAKDNELDEVVALKILPESISNNPEAVRRFKIEARSARRLSHPNIIRIHDIGEEMGRKYISMEIVEGTDLKAKFRKDGPPPLGILAKWCMDIGSALAYAHRMGIVHRDIKPANIMIDETETVKVADFGIAKNMGAADATMTGAVMGTPLYMSPEQVRGEHIDHRADIYSFGVMMYELSTGKPPFSEGDLAYQHIHVDPKPMEGVDPRWNELILKCLAKDREERWADLDEMQDELRTFIKEL